MNKRDLTATLLLALSPAAVPAEPVPADAGCEVLAKLVVKHVHLAATQVASARTGVPARGADIGRTSRYLCRRTAEVTTRAFGEALAALNMPIGWEPPHPGDYCWSGNLEHCYPGIEPGDPRLPAGRLAFVYDAWQGVRDAVQSQMLTGGAGAAAVYSADSLDAALASHLRESVEGPLHVRYAVR